MLKAHNLPAWCLDPNSTPTCTCNILGHAEEVHMHMQHPCTKSCSGCSELDWSLHSQFCAIGTVHCNVALCSHAVITELAIQLTHVLLCITRSKQFIICMHSARWLTICCTAVLPCVVPVACLPVIRCRAHALVEAVHVLFANVPSTTNSDYVSNTAGGTEDAAGIVSSTAEVDELALVDRASN